ncbi:hypothetical protein BCV72DRAFT_230708 [Rhizopus microsporus var. microsporus]|uniref:Uncharacterized protein n=2 Tax=Rhizopus microsporus TaxID=58291 RepID=A0A2G4STD8_RHIZD|nr:uncharacterized protein RHIMIDRAFT_283812 [Rhizopus microsporus ATCC 52813]ORE04990.1 hypothetical protein BCV72DRAFT_230708 [Rhizopus microsporus var. microsporus]PHZ12033.1 hypothetical protein RHIMIDRAFT_283812 [Rhizopus microsporus ATCC 52813]
MTNTKRSKVSVSNTSVYLGLSVPESCSFSSFLSFFLDIFSTSLPSSICFLLFWSKRLDFQAGGVTASIIGHFESY